jgi:hypothetical protein
VVRGPANAVAGAPAAQAERIIEVIPREEEARQDDLERHEHQEGAGHEQIDDHERREHGQQEQAEERGAQRAGEVRPEGPAVAGRRKADGRVVEANEPFERGRGEGLGEQQAGDEREGEGGDEREQRQGPAAGFAEGRDARGNPAIERAR